MKAILDLDVHNKERKRLIETFVSFCDLNISKQIITYMNVLEREGFRILSKKVDILYDFDDDIGSYVNRQQIFYKIVERAKKVLKDYQDDLLFYDKLKLFTTNEPKLIWILNETHTMLVPQDIIYNDIIRYERKIGSRIYLLDIKQGMVELVPDYLELEEIEEPNYRIEL